MEVPLQTQDSPRTSKTLGDVLRERIEKMAGVEIEEHSRYYAVRKNGDVLGWVSGRRRFRVDFPDPATVSEHDRPRRRSLEARAARTSRECR
jgi:hypothetical protein